MLPYLFLFAFFAVGAFMTSGKAALAPVGGADTDERHWVASTGFMFLLGAAMIASLIGFRFEVGADWPAYVGMWQWAGRVDMATVLERGDPGYFFLNWLAQQAGLGVWAVNLACGSVFSWGLYRFAKVQPLPWLTIVVAMPYLVTVVALGYSRQAVAIGFLLAGLASLSSGGSLIRFAVYAVLAALFHKTAVVMLPLVIFSTNRSRLLAIVGGFLLVYALYTSLLADDVKSLVKNYVEAKYSSQGALIRVLLCFIPALLFFKFRDRMQFDPVQMKFWRLSSLAALGLMVALFVIPSSTAVDRVALYILPLQLAVLSRLPLAMPGPLTAVGVVAYSLLIQLVWLLYAAHASYWVPYNFYPF